MQNTATPAPRIVVIQHEDAVPLDRLGPALAGADVLTLRPDAGDALPSVSEIDGLIVLGGTMNVHDDERAPWLPELKSYLRDAVESGTATLGVCLGAQLLAVALGGEVEVDAPAGIEQGIVELRIRPDGEHDPLIGQVVAALGRDVLAPSSHRDAICALPEDAIWLASSRQYPFQAFRVGSAWGIQFHPEAGEDLFASWTARAGGDVAAARADHRTAADRLTSLVEVIGTTFTQLAGDRVAR
ncbi:type 1 glutamine amidotransferase [Pseudactinotalea suaedae]|uniref:type 1 glutamine amidotransferase n=1 Tax=Pseudactinotalea suaedae TaxID=1524924 RepID=UPI001391471E|nr:type 1 glutamine amidotransferase [Pseudactinotalea suaedae]